MIVESGPGRQGVRNRRPLLSVNSRMTGHRLKSSVISDDRLFPGIVGKIAAQSQKNGPLRLLQAISRLVNRPALEPVFPFEVRQVIERVGWIGPRRQLLFPELLTRFDQSANHAEVFEYV